MRPPRFSPFAVLLLGLAYAGCSGGSSGGGAPPPPPPGGGGNFGLTQRVTVSGLTFPNTGQQQTSGPLTFNQAFTNLGNFQNPIQITAPNDGTDRLLVVEQRGVIHVFDNVDTVPASTVFLDIQARVSSGGEEGLLGLCFDPNYTNNGFFYVHYSASGPRRSVISRFTVTGNPNQADANSEVVILEVNQPFGNHNAGMLEFGPDNLLYIAMGDGGSGGDPQGNGQNSNTLLGSMLRIDVSSLPYTIPPNNPFVGGGGAPEIYATGLRNPWRFSFDSQTGDLWVGDVGQGDREEISVINRGDNLGWNVFEGNLVFAGGQPASNFQQPVIDYARLEGTTVVGGYVYRGTTLTSHVGTYLYGDHGSGRVWALTFDSSFNVTSNTEITNIGQLTSFGEDRDGEIFAVSYDGRVWRLVAGGGTPPPPGQFPQTLSATGLFTNLTTLVPTPGLVEYDVIVSFWSDGAVKRRWIALPGNDTISFDPTNPWQFPTGTVIVKHFEMETTPGSFQRLETRVLVNETSGWAGYTYEWNGAQTDANLVSNGVDVPLTVLGQQQTYRIPSEAECMQCHTSAAGRILGVRTHQLNGDFQYPSMIDNQLRSWNNISLFSSDIGAATQFAAFPDLTDTTVSEEERSRAYLATNCSQCHQPGGPAPGGIDFRFTTFLGNTNTVNVAPSEGDLGLINPMRIDPGSKETSVVWERIRRTDPNRMPPLASNVVDPTAESLLGSWIDGL